MRLMFLAATALSVSGTALAYQTAGADVDASMTPPEATATATIGVDPGVAIGPLHSWTPEQRVLYEQHLATFPAGWTADQKAAFEALMAVPPASWTPDQRALYEQHFASLPSTWTVEQRTLYERQIASLRTPWIGTTQTASIDPVAATPAQVNLQTFAGMGGPYEEVYGSGSVNLTPRPADQNYPPCDPGPGDDNCIQLYERGVRDQLASWNRPTGGLFDGSSTTAMGGPFEPAAQPETTSPEATTPTQPDPVGTTEDDTTQPDSYE